jgi:hypothetical protein
MRKSPARGISRILARVCPMSDRHLGFRASAGCPHEPRGIHVPMLPSSHASGTATPAMPLLRADCPFLDVRRSPLSQIPQSH